MSANFWIGVIVVVCVLELIRIGLSTFVLLHILERISSLSDTSAKLPVRPTRLSHRGRAKREMLVQPTLISIREAMDELNAGTPGTGVERAIAALDQFMLEVHEDTGR